jgi:hypothetical protein
MLLGWSEEVVVLVELGSWSSGISCPATAPTDRRPRSHRVTFPGFAVFDFGNGRGL